MRTLQLKQFFRKFFVNTKTLWKKKINLEVPYIVSPSYSVIYPNNKNSAGLIIPVVRRAHVSEN